MYLQESGIPFCGTEYLEPEFSPPFFQKDTRGENPRGRAHLYLFDLAVGVRVDSEIPDRIDAVVLDEQVSYSVSAFYVNDWLVAVG